MVDIFEKKRYLFYNDQLAEFLIFNSDNLSRNFITCVFFLLSNIFLSTDQFFNDDYLDLWGFQVKWSTLN